MDLYGFTIMYVLCDMLYVMFSFRMIHHVLIY